MDRSIIQCRRKNVMERFIIQCTILGLVMLTHLLPRRPLIRLSVLHVNHPVFEQRTPLLPDQRKCKGWFLVRTLSCRYSLLHYSFLLSNLRQPKSLLRLFLLETFPTRELYYIPVDWHFIFKLIYKCLTFIQLR